MYLIGSIPVKSRYLRLQIYHMQINADMIQSDEHIVIHMSREVNFVGLSYCLRFGFVLTFCEVRIQERIENYIFY